MEKKRFWGLSRNLSLLCGICAVFLFLAVSGEARNAEESRGEMLFQAFFSRLAPEKMVMILDEEPDQNGRVRHLYLDLQGPCLGGVRIERLAVEAWDVQFNPVEEWALPGEDSVRVEEVLQTYADGVLTEKDLNDDLLQKKFGDEKDWHDIYLDFTPRGLHAQGKYRVKLLFTFDMLIEIDGVLGLRKGREIWLEEYRFRVNKVNVPDSLTRGAVEELQPLLDLGRYMFPLRLHTLEMDEEKVILRSSRLPQPFEGRRYEKSGTKEINGK
ncbi:MAG TPA: DUF2993 domain-containing protein [Synergistaceae bacterium]|nr:DUF2993 domain-containing protein [Synergistaceae bacterium]HPJ24543.1 DUF2993 domain-containing protein [Synergistaceae bacterium]HPQ36300.1 DUF2993 domain-containing protein [Synergistaceae bacterium]